MSNDIKKLLENTKYDEIEKLIKNRKNNIIKISFEEIISNYLNKNNFKLSKIVYENDLIFVDNVEVERKDYAQ